MPTAKVVISLPQTLKAKLDTVRGQGYTVSGYVRELLELDLTAREQTGRLGKPWRQSKRQKGR